MARRRFLEAAFLFSNIERVLDSLTIKFHHVSTSNVGLFVGAEMGKGKKIVRQKKEKQQIIAVLKFFLSQGREGTNKGVWWMPRL